MRKQMFTATALALVALLLAGCGGDDNIRDERDERDALQAELTDTQKALEEAKAAEQKAKDIAEQAAAEAEKAKDIAEQAAAETEKAKDIAEQAAAEAEKAKTAEAEAQSQADTAAQQRQDEAERRAEAERQKKALETEVEKATQRVNTAEAKQVFAGLEEGEIVPGTVMPVLGSRVAATITTGPSTTTPSVNTGSAGKWFRTSRSGTTSGFSDTLEIYSDVEAPKSSLFADSDVYNVDFESKKVIDSDLQVRSAYPLGSDSRDDAASSAFPRSTGTKTIQATDRGFKDQDEKVAAVDACKGRVGGCSDSKLTSLERLTTNRDVTRYPFRYMAYATGSLASASGAFRCGSDQLPKTACRVRNSGSELMFLGGGPEAGGVWTFRPASGTVNVRVADAEHMHFGWWTRKELSNDTWTFKAFHGGGVEPTNIWPVTGTATYVGPASGYYAMSLPSTSQSRHGKFDATATMRANFGSADADADDFGTLSGTITNFRQEPEWSLTLKEVSFNAAGTASNTSEGVAWAIGENVTDGGLWEAQLYSNVPPAAPDDTPTFDATRPAGVAGTFEAEFGDVVVGRMIGAFGAHYTGP